MILYNVTVNIDDAVHDEWLKWMKEVHIPDVMNTGHFVENKICKILAESEGGVSYSIQYFCESMNELETYQANHAARLQKEHTDKYAGRFAAFRTLLEVVHQQN
jgi:hypothetical protein